MRTLLLAATFGLLVAAAPSDTDVSLPKSPVAEPIEGAYTRVTVFADGTIAHAGAPIPRAPDRVAHPELIASLRAWHAEEPDGAVLLAADRRADLRAVREVLASMTQAGVATVGFLAAREGSPPRVLSLSNVHFATSEAGSSGVVLPPLMVHLRASAYEAHCDARACDLVLRTDTRRIALGERPKDARSVAMLFGRPVHAYDGRLGVAGVEREGALSPFVLLPGTRR